MSILSFPCKQCLVLVMCKSRYHGFYSTRKMAKYDELACISDTLLLMRVRCDILRNYFDLARATPDIIKARKREVHKFMLKGYNE